MIPRPTRQLNCFFALLLVATLLGSGCDKHPAGASGKESTRFTRFGPKAVFLAGQFNDWSATASPMHREGADRWIIELPLPPGRYEYKFVVDGQWERDVTNPETVPDGWGGLNSVIVVPPSPLSQASKEKEETQAPPPLVRKEARWKRINYPYFPIPGAGERKITALIAGASSEIMGQRERLHFVLLFYQAANEETPDSLAHPKEFVVRLHLPDGEMIAAEAEGSGFWDGAGNSEGMTRSRHYYFPWTRNAYDEAWIEWRLAGQTFWFEIPYGFTRDPTEPWPTADPERSEPTLAAAMQGLPPQDRLVPWLHVEYELGEIQNHWKLFTRMGNPFRPAAEVTLYQAPDQNMRSWEAAKPETGIQIRGQGEGRRVAFRKVGGLERIDTFRISYGDSDKGRESEVVVVHVDDRSYEFTVPSSLFKYVHGTADYENKQRLPRGDGLFEALVRLAD